MMLPNSGLKPLVLLLAAFSWQQKSSFAGAPLVARGKEFTLTSAPEHRGVVGQSRSARVSLPRTFLQFEFPATPGRSIRVGSGGNLQRALNSAERGDEIVLAAGATFTGNYTLPAKSGTAASGWIVVRSEQLAQLPAIGTRVSATQASLMPRIVTPNTEPAVRTAADASGWWLAGLEVTVSPSLTAQQYALINLGDPSEEQSTLARVPSDLVLDRMYIHGQTNTNMSRCVGLHSARTQVSDSYITECHGRDFDSQAIWGGNGPGPFKIVNNMLQGAGENLMFGGYIPPIRGLIPSDIEIRRNHFHTPKSWQGRWLKKNLFELKNAARVLVEGNVFEGSWTDGQTGWAVIVRDDGCAWCFTADVTIRRNLIRHAGAGINIANPLNRGTARVHVAENVLDSLGTAGFTGELRAFQVLGSVNGVTLERNLVTGNALQAALLPEGGAPCVFRDNVWASGTYGVIASGAAPGSSSLSTGCGGGYVWSGNTMIGSSNGNAYPAGTIWAASEARVLLASQIRRAVREATAGVVIH